MVEKDLDAEDKIPERVKYSYGIVVDNDIPDEVKKKEMVEICQIACEKFAPAEKTPLERNNQRAAEMIKVN